MGKKSRTKGAGGEREVAELLSKVYPGTCRELDQYQGKLGRDLKGCAPWCVQIKRMKSVSEKQKEDAFMEAVSACGGEWILPVVFYREDRAKWRAYTSMYVLLCHSHGEGVLSDGSLMVDMDAEEFVEWIDAA